MTHCFPRLRSPIILGCAALAVLAAASDTARANKAQSPGPQAAPLLNLTRAADLRDQFNADHGTVRIVLLLSPT